MTKMPFQNLDWNLLRQQADNRKTGPRKQAADWDDKAASFASRAVHTIYTERFLDLLAPEPQWSVLDIGCGPGTLALPLASRVSRVTALDFSANMLKILRQRAAEQDLHNISTCQLSWEDDWSAQNIKAHDVAIASRSLAVADLKTALTRLNNFAEKRVCITDRVKSGPKDPDAFAAVGRELNNGPDYIYTINLLYQMGIQASIEFIPLEETLTYSSFAEALAAYTWMFHGLSETETRRLEHYVRSISNTGKDGSVSVHRRQVPTWAFISWIPTPLT
jgi:SAM-dependent methyltransferase